MKAVTCDQCGKSFGISLKADTLPDGGERWWFKCLHCGHRTEVADITAEGVQIREQLERLKRSRGSAAAIARLQKAMAAEVSKP